MNTPVTIGHTLHGAVDKILRRQQGRLLGRLREGGTLHPQAEATICRSLAWIGEDFHRAIEKQSTESLHVTPSK